MHRHPDSTLALAHSAALELLAHVRDYLLRLPMVPATRDEAWRIDAFLADPKAAAARLSAEAARAAEQTRGAAHYDADGRPSLVAVIRRNELELQGPAIECIADHQVAWRTGDEVPARTLPLQPAQPGVTWPRLGHR